MVKCYYLFSAIDSVSKAHLLLAWITDVTSVIPQVWIYIIPPTTSSNRKTSLNVCLKVRLKTTCRGVGGVFLKKINLKTH